MIQSTCDHCGPSTVAWVYVEVKGSELAYCGSCSGRFMDVWVARGYRVIADYRYMIPG